MLEVIATHWLIFACQEKEGAWSPKCLELARKHSMAVDAPKLGTFPALEAKDAPASVPKFLKEFSKKGNVDHDSQGILSKLYESAEADLKNVSDSTQAFRSVQYHEARFECFLRSACELRDEYNARLLVILRKAGSGADEAGLMAGTWSHARGWTRSQTDEDEMTKIQFRKLWGWAREEFEAAVGRQQCGNDHEKMKVRKQIACAFYHSVYDPAIERTQAVGGSAVKEIKLLNFGWVAHEELLNATAGPGVCGVSLERRSSAPSSSLPPGRSASSSEAPAGVALAQDDADAGGMGLQLFGDETPEACVRRFLDARADVARRGLPNKKPTELFVFDAANSVLYGVWEVSPDGAVERRKEIPPISDRSFLSDVLPRADELRPIGGVPIFLNKEDTKLLLVKCFWYRNSRGGRPAPTRTAERRQARRRRRRRHHEKEECRRDLR